MTDLHGVVRRWPQRSLLWVGIAVEILLIGVVRLGDLRFHVPGFWALIFPVFALYLSAVWIALCVLRRSRGSLLTILVFATIFRVTLLLTPPTLSDDLYRYLWDGRTQFNRINPYRYAPDAEAVAHLRDEYYPKINHKHIPTIYPPLAQIVFLAAYAIHPTPWGMKLTFTLFDAGIIALLLWLLRRMGHDLNRVLIYAWSPLTLIEVAGSGHNEPLAVLLLLLSVYLALQGGQALSSIALALSALSKFLAVALLPPWMALGYQRTSQRSLRRWTAIGGLFLLTFVLGYLPYLSAGADLFVGLKTYAAEWRSNDSLFALVYALTGSSDLSRLIAGGTFGGVILYVILRRFDPLRAAYWIVGAFLLLTTTLHPWYLVWMIPFLCLFPHPAWLYLSGAVFLSYQALIGYVSTGAWELAPWVRWLEYGPFCGILLWDWLSGKIGGHRRAASDDLKRPMSQKVLA